MSAAVYIQALERRADHLALRVSEARARGKDFSFDASELRALLWAIQQLRPHQDERTPYAGTPGAFRP